MRPVNQRASLWGAVFVASPGLWTECPRRTAGLTWELSPDRVTSQLYFGRRDTQFPDQQAYSQTIYGCGSRLKSFLSFERSRSELQHCMIRKLFPSWPVRSKDWELIRLVMICSSLSGHAAQPRWSVSADRRWRRCSVRLAGLQPQTAVHLPGLRRRDPLHGHVTWPKVSHTDMPQKSHMEFFKDCFGVFCMNSINHFLKLSWTMKLSSVSWNVRTY